MAAFKKPCSTLQFRKSKLLSGDHKKPVHVGFDPEARQTLNQRSLPEAGSGWKKHPK